MTVHTTAWTMTSDITPESAYREAGNANAWRLSWLPDRLLTQAQARLGMELDELLSNPHAVYDQRAQARVDTCADLLGVSWEEALLLLANRMAQRLQHGQRAEGEAAPPGRAPRSQSMRTHSVEPPYAHH